MPIEDGAAVVGHAGQPYDICCGAATTVAVFAAIQDGSGL